MSIVQYSVHTSSPHSFIVHNHVPDCQPMYCTVHTSQSEMLTNYLPCYFRSHGPVFVYCTVMYRLTGGMMRMMSLLLYQRLTDLSRMSPGEIDTVGPNCDRSMVMLLFLP